MYGTGTLHLFGITCRTSSTDGTNYIAVNHDSDSDSDTDDYGGWNTTYYNLKGECGTSSSQGSSYSYGTHSVWETSYNDANGKYLGKSISEGVGYSSTSYDSWSTTYYNSDNVECGSSMTRGNSYCSGSYNSWETTYCNSNGEYGTSFSQGTNYSSGSYSGWNTDFSNCIIIKQIKPEVGISLVNELEHTQCVTNTPISKTKSNIISKVIPATDHKMILFMNGAKEYYISQTRCKCINASCEIFMEGRSSDGIISDLRYRSRKNPNGASYKTLRKFGY